MNNIWPKDLFYKHTHWVHKLNKWFKGVAKVWFILPIFYNGLFILIIIKRQRLIYYSTLVGLVLNYRIINIFWEF